MHIYSVVDGLASVRQKSNYYQARCIPALEHFLNTKKIVIKTQHTTQQTLCCRPEIRCKKKMGNCCWGDSEEVVSSNTRAFQGQVRKGSGVSSSCFIQTATNLCSSKILKNERKLTRDTLWGLRMLRLPHTAAVDRNSKRVTKIPNRFITPI